MEISRKGAAADHGTRTISLGSIDVKMSVLQDSIIVKSKKPVRDFARTGCSHDYKIKVDVADFVAMIKAVSNEIKSVDDEEVNDMLISAIPDFLKIANVLSLRS